MVLSNYKKRQMYDLAKSLRYHFVISSSELDRIEWRLRTGTEVRE